MRGLQKPFVAAIVAVCFSHSAFAQVEEQVVEIELIESADPKAERKPYPEDKVIEAADSFFDALGSDDKTALATMMIPEATIFVHNRMDPDSPSIAIVAVADHLSRWERDTRNVSERMFYQNVHMSGDLGYVQGPYSFSIEGIVSHCGVNYLSMAKTEDGWKVGNTSFTMVPPDQCKLVGAHWVDQ